MLIARFGFVFAAFAVLLTAGETRNIILVTADGLRWQEVFQGIDPALANQKATHMDKADARRAKYARATARESREALMPFFWKQLAAQGTIIPNVKVTNAYRVSYPGYSEIL